MGEKRSSPFSNSIFPTSTFNFNEFVCGTFSLGDPRVTRLVSGTSRNQFLAANIYGEILNFQRGPQGGHRNFKVKFQ